MLLACVLLWCALIVLPVFITSDSPATKSVFAFFSLICHQLDSHSLHVNGQAMAVCARCSAVYFGFLMSVILLPVFRVNEINNQRIWWFIALLPMVVDVACHIAGLHESTWLTRVITGGFFGIIAGWILIPLLISVIVPNEKQSYPFLRGIS